MHRRAAIELSVRTIIIIGLGVILFVFLVLFLTNYFPKIAGFLTQLSSGLLPNLTDII